MLAELESLVQGQILPWMQECSKDEKGHEQCRLLRNPTVYPVRLVDVGTAQDPFVKLVETINLVGESERLPYMILSYCWGQGNTSAKTTSGNLARRLQGIPTPELPKTIQDAILVTRMMGFRYIWIDAICIIQATDENDLVDFISEAPKMGDYYANAECCISASLASDSAQGFLVPRLMARFPLETIILKLTDTSTTPSEPVVLGAYQYDDEYLERGVLKSPLMKRGWYMQEYVLSRQVMHWTSHGLFLACHTSALLEGSGRVSPKKRFGVNDARGVLALPNDRILTIDGRYMLIEQFSTQALSFDSDRLYAIHGIACFLVKRLGTEYFYGLFRQHLAQGLAWYHCGNNAIVRGKISLTTSKPRTQFPSWCWASDCPVGFHKLDEDSVYLLDDHPRRPRLFPTHPGNLALTGTESRLYIRAPLIPVILGKNFAALRQYCTDSRHTGYHYRCVIDSPIEGTTWSTVPNDVKFEALGPGVVVQWLLVGRERGDMYEWTSGMLVEEVDCQETGVYRRYGYLLIHWADHSDSTGLWVHNEDIRNLHDGLHNIILE